MSRDRTSDSLSRRNGVEERPKGESRAAAAAAGGGAKRFGASGGVFTPSILTILGVVMYLRLGWVVG